MTNENFQKDWIEHTKIHPWQKHMQKKMFRDMFSVKQTVIKQNVFLPELLNSAFRST